ncbi:MAG: RNA polymerase sigma factor, partial [Actinomycetota bacterium]
METDRTRTEDHALIARVTAGDRVALEMLYRRHARWLTARLQARCGDPDITDLAVQDTFLAVWRSAKKFRGDGDVGAWIWGIGIRRLVDQLRKRRPDPLDPGVVAALAGDMESMPSSEDELLAAGGDATTALAGLEPDLRAVFVLTVVDGLTTREAARLLGVPQGTVKTRA